MSRHCCLPILMLLIAACSPAPTRAPLHQAEGEASYRSLPTQASRRYALTAGDVVEQPEAVINPSPVYPADLLGLNLAPVELDVRVAVDAAGAVSDCFALVPADPAADPHLHAFFDAIRHVTRQWHFTPLRIRHLEDVDENGDGEPDAVRQGEPVPMPFSLDYRFRFSVVNGKAQVDQGTAH